MAKFKKKEDIERLTKSILKHKIQTLTGKSIKTLEEEMEYKAKDPNEPSMDVDTMRRLASSLVLLASDELPEYTPPPAPVQVGSKRPAPGAGEGATPAKKVSRRSVAVTETSQVSAGGGSARKLARRSVAAVPSTGASSLLSTPGSSRRSRKSELNTSASSSVSQVSLSVTNCLGPDKSQAEQLAAVQEDAENTDPTLVNPTPLMKEMIKKRRSVASNNTPVKTVKSVKKSKVKVSSVSSDEGDQPSAVVRPASPPPRQDFPGAGDNKVYLVSGDPMDLKLSKIISTLPLSSQFRGAQVSVVHTPADWTPTEIFKVTNHIKMMNKVNYYVIEN